MNSLIRTGRAINTLLEEVETGYYKPKCYFENSTTVPRIFFLIFKGAVKKYFHRPL